MTVSLILNAAFAYVKFKASKVNLKWAYSAANANEMAEVNEPNKKTIG